MNDNIKKIVKTLKGTLLVVSVNNNYILDSISKNKNLKEIYSLDRTKIFNKPLKKTNNVKLRKLKKKFKNKLDYMLCDVNGINIDLNKVIYNTYSIIDKEIIYYGIYDEYDVDRIIAKYTRFGATCNKKMYDKEFILRVDIYNIKVSKLFIYKILDFFKDVIEFIGNLLMS